MTLEMMWKVKFRKIIGEVLSKARLVNYSKTGFPMCHGTESKVLPKFQMSRCTSEGWNFVYLEKYSEGDRHTEGGSYLENWRMGGD
jgi:hypothetical protein